jgi:integrase
VRYTGYNLSVRRRPARQCYPFQYRVTFKGGSQYVIGKKKAESMPGKREVITFRTQAWLWTMDGAPDVNVTPIGGGLLISGNLTSRVAPRLKRVTVYGATRAEALAKAEELEDKMPEAIRMLAGRHDVDRIGLKEIRREIKIIKQFEQGVLSVDAIREKDKIVKTPTVEALVQRSIDYKASQDLSTVADRANKTKLVIKVSHGYEQKSFGSLMASEITQTQLIEWIKACRELPGCREGEKLSRHSIQQCISMVKGAWKQLAVTEYAECAERLRFDESFSILLPPKPISSGKATVRLEVLRAIANLPDLTEVEMAVFGLQLMGLRPNEIGAVLPSDIVRDTNGRSWLEPTGSVSDVGRKRRPKTKIGDKENRSLPLPAYVLRLFGDFSPRPFLADDGSGKPLSDDNVRNIFKALVARSGHRLEDGESSHAMRHTSSTNVIVAAGYDVGDKWTSGKIPSSMVGQHYGLLSMREKRKLARSSLTVNGVPVCDLLPWADW